MRKGVFYVKKICSIEKKVYLCSPIRKTHFEARIWTTD